MGLLSGPAQPPAGTAGRWAYAARPPKKTTGPAGASMRLVCMKKPTGLAGALVRLVCAKKRTSPHGEPARLCLSKLTALAAQTISLRKSRIILLATSSASTS